ncbi:Uncharacterized protein L728 [Coccomyxa sp. Obi]|nr:Uncharacterized protein L728 [Coccomyxa sp. Obi]
MSVKYEPLAADRVSAASRSFRSFSTTMAASTLEQWEHIMAPPGELGSELSKLKVSAEPLLSGPWNNFCLLKPEGFALPTLNEEAAVTSTVLESLLPSLPSVGRAAPQTTEVHASAPFVDMLMPQAANLESRTENGAATFSSSGSSLVDFFFQILEDSTCSTVHTLLTQAWKEEPLAALQLIAHLRDIRNGKGENARALDTYVWLAKHHPRTLLANLPEMVKCGYWKDLLEILVRLCVGEEEWAARVKAAEKHKISKGDNVESRKAAKKERLKEWRTSLRSLKDSDAREAAKSERAAANAEAVKARAEADKDRRHAAQLAGIERAQRKFKEDEVYRALHTAVAVLFADQLKRDLADMQSGKKASSLAAKWAPTPKGHHDKDTLIATAIAELLYPEAVHRQEGVSYDDYAELARRSMHKEYISVLRSAAPVTEVLMSKRKWGEIDYGRVASVCMKRNKRTFEYHDKERLQEHLSKVKKGEAKVNAGALKPHELVHEAMLKARACWMRSTRETVSDLGMEVAEAQWKAYVEKLRESGELSSAMAICDVSGSMDGQPMEVAIALSLLTAEVTKPPFNKLICTFSATPELHLVKGSSLVEQVEDIKEMQWSGNTDVNAVFTLLLKRAVMHKLKPEDMIKTLFIFSDMEFDSCVTLHEEPFHSYYSSYYSSQLYLGSFDRMQRKMTNYETVKAQFEAAGYTLPQVVFWNLRDSSVIPGQKSTPVTVNEKGVALVSGFSGHLLELFMDKGGDVEAWKEGMSPMAVMMAAIREHGRYDAWKVVN